MPRIICAYCGEEIEPWFAYKPDSTLEFGLAYCSKEEYEKAKEEEAQRAEKAKADLRKYNGNDLESAVNEVIGNVCELSKQMKDRINTWTNGDDPRILTCFLEENLARINKSITKKDIQTLYGRINYLETVVQSEYPAYATSYKLRKKELEERMAATQKNAKAFVFVENNNRFQRRKGFSEEESK